MTTITSPLRTPPRQRRSQATSDAIIEAGVALLDDRDFLTVSVADLAARARVSIGGFYARFKSKDALLHVLAERVTDDCAVELERAVERASARSGKLEPVIRAYAGVMVSKFREHRRAIGQILRYARSGDSHVAKVIGRFNDRVHGQLRQALLARRAEIAHPDPNMAIEFGMFVVSAAAREGVLGNALQAYPIALDDDGLTDQLVRLYLGYLKGQPVQSPGKTANRAWR